MSDLLPYLPGLALVWAALAFGFAAPGPTMLGVMGTALGRDRRAAIFVAIGTTVGSTIWALLSGSALARLFPEGSYSLWVLRNAAAVYLGIIAVAFAHSAWKGARQDVPAIPGGEVALMTAGLVISLTNLKGAIFWLAAAVVAVGPQAPPSVIVALAAGSALISGIGHGAYALVFSSRKAYEIYDAWRRPVQAGLAAFFTGAGALVLLGATHRI